MQLAPILLISSTCALRGDIQKQSACKGVGGWYSFYFPTYLVYQNNSALFSNLPEQMRDYQELQYTPGERQTGSILHKNMSRHLSTWPWRQKQTIFVFNPLVSDLGNIQTFRDHLGCRYWDRYYYVLTRSLGALRALISSWRPFRPLDVVLCALLDIVLAFRYHVCLCLWIAC